MVVNAPDEQVRVSEPDCSLHPLVTPYVHDAPEASVAPAVHPPFVPAGAAGRMHPEAGFCVQVGSVTLQTPLVQLVTPPSVRV